MKMAMMMICMTSVEIVVDDGDDDGDDDDDEDVTAMMTNIAIKVLMLLKTKIMVHRNSLSSR